MKLGEILRALRESNGFTQKQVADMLKLDRSTYSYYESEKTAPDLSAIIKIARMYNVTPNDLLGFSNSSSHVADSSSDEYYKGLLDKIYKKGLSRGFDDLDKNEQNLIILYRLVTNKKGLVEIAKDFYNNEIHHDI